jgi:hypothetical protein
MKTFRILAATAATAGAAGLAVPALAQTPYPYPYPQQTYPQYQYPQTGYAYPGQQGYAQNPVGAIINQLLGNRYSVTDRQAVTQCAAAAQAQAAAQYRPNAYGQPYQQGYGQGYGYQGYPGYNVHSSARVTAITDVQRRNNGLRVSGLMSSGMMNAYGGYGGYGGYNPAYANSASDLSFRCNVAYNGQVTDVRVRRNTAGYRR